MDGYRIGELAHMAGTTTRTLRFYEEAGCSRPRAAANAAIGCTAARTPTGCRRSCCCAAAAWRCATSGRC